MPTVALFIPGQVWCVLRSGWQLTTLNILTLHVIDWPCQQRQYWHCTGDQCWPETPLTVSLTPVNIMAATILWVYRRESLAVSHSSSSLSNMTPLQASFFHQVSLGWRWDHSAAHQMSLIPTDHTHSHLSFISKYFQTSQIYLILWNLSKLSIITLCGLEMYVVIIILVSFA